VRAVRLDARINLALRIDFLGSASSGQGLVTITGLVDSVDSGSLVLKNETTVLHDETTIWTGEADGWWSVASDWQVEALAFRDIDERLVARRVRGISGRRPTIEGHQYEPREALVLLVEGADPEAVAARHRAEVVGLANDTAVLLRWSRELNDRLLAVVADDPRVVAVEPNYLFRDPESVRRRYVVVDRLGNEEKLLSQVAGSVVNLSDLAKGRYGSGVVVAVLDTGVDPGHSLLAERILPGGLDLVDGDDEPWEERNLVDDNDDGVIDEAAGHGTFVASVIALIAPEARILPYRILDDDGSGTAFSLALALAHAMEAGVDVINLSLTYQERSLAVDELLEKAAEAGIVVVAAAGNDGASAVPFPASDSHVLAVTGVDVDGLQLASFANRSSLVRMAAPSVQVYGAVDGSQWGTWDGTSFAAPFVSGTVAAFLSIDPGLDRDLILLLLEQTGRELSDGAWSGRLLDIQRSFNVFGLGTAGSWRDGVSGRYGIAP
jgi:subtilisin family serine protease